MSFTDPPHTPVQKAIQTGTTGSFVIWTPPDNGRYMVTDMVLYPTGATYVKIRGDTASGSDAGGNHTGDIPISATLPLIFMNLGSPFRGIRRSGGGEGRLIMDVMTSGVQIGGFVGGWESTT